MHAVTQKRTLRFVRILTSSAEHKTLLEQDQAEFVGAKSHGQSSASPSYPRVHNKVPLLEQLSLSGQSQGTILHLSNPHHGVGDACH